MFIMHGLADNIAGPWDWTSQPPVCQHCGENPAFVAFKNASSGDMVYSLWVGGKVWAATTPYGPFSVLPGSNLPAGGSNAAPVYHNAAFYMTTQKTTEVYTSPTLDHANWTKYADISHDTVPTNWMIE